MTPEKKNNIRGAAKKENITDAEKRNEKKRKSEKGKEKESSLFHFEHSEFDQ